MHRPQLDKYDQRILQYLQQDGRISNQELAERIGLSPAACWRRVKALEEAGVIRGFVALVDPVQVGQPLNVLVMVTLQRHSIDNTTEFESRMREYPEVLQCYATTGQADFILRVVIQDMPAYDRFLNEKIFTLKGIAQVNSNFALREIKNETAMPLG
ncbi:Lrp/AsnC family transcriptional regulator [Marinospirillum alkaliphilum]|uniref:Transcriptional regulator, AsnC family n=1 Tax=Marinospirillum alkaliphilum DSM 21637 TaxID=1122209 RepID=A0A1K1TZI5_9GAMM|nr:Lrp/AsnC family transcriptional regulator [Marinospirillum alkaliphilum]SFX05605.1 transcriptional regulator, AsnC family [Marinospirillum alkaliphilum DSM 21637]